MAPELTGTAIAFSDPPRLTGTAAAITDPPQLWVVGVSWLDPAALIAVSLRFVEIDESTLIASESFDAWIDGSTEGAALATETFDAWVADLTESMLLFPETFDVWETIQVPIDNALRLRNGEFLQSIVNPLTGNRIQVWVRPVINGQRATDATAIELNGSDDATVIYSP